MAPKVVVNWVCVCIYSENITSSTYINPNYTAIPQMELLFLHYCKGEIKIGTGQLVIAIFIPSRASNSTHRILT